MANRVLMLAWEYPPDHVGGLGRHVCHLGRALARRGVEVTVLTKAGNQEAGRRVDEGVNVIPVRPYGLNPPDFVTWALELNVALLESAMRDLAPEFDVIHTHDWILGYAARALKHAWRIPLISTVHATECGRQNGLHTPLQRHISETEWWVCFESWRVITCSNFMRREVMGTFGVPGDKIRVIPNGISGDWFTLDRKPDRDPLILYVGRLVREKGPQHAIECMPEVLREYPSARLVLAGTGPMEGDLRKLVFELGLEGKVDLVGMQGDAGLKDLYSRAHVAVFPSSYEPFGIVALEAMATGVPCVVGDAGGLSEIVHHGVTGLKVLPKDVTGLAGAIKAILGDPSLGQRLTARAREAARTDYSWDDVARRTSAVYLDVVQESQRTSFSRRRGDEALKLLLDRSPLTRAASRGAGTGQD